MRFYNHGFFIDFLISVLSILVFSKRFSSPGRALPPYFSTRVGFSGLKMHSNLSLEAQNPILTSEKLEKRVLSRKKRGQITMPSLDRLLESVQNQEIKTEEEGHQEIIKKSSRNERNDNNNGK